MNIEFLPDGGPGSTTHEHTDGASHLMAAVAARDAADGGEQGAARHAAFKGGVHLVVGRAGAERQGYGYQVPSYTQTEVNNSGVSLQSLSNCNQATAKWRSSLSCIQLSKSYDSS